MAEALRQGVGAVLDINGETRAFRDLRNQLPTHISNLVSPNDIHLTLVDSAETAIPILSPRDALALSDVATQWHKYLGGLPLKGCVLRPSNENGRRGRQLAKFGRFLGFAIENSEMIQEIRGSLADILAERAGIRIGDRDFVPHVAVSYLFKRKRYNTRRDSPMSPPGYHVVGWSISQRHFREDSGRLRQKQAYVNHPPRR